ncbi:unnamed protein product [Rotaria magnacalcarata]
MLDKDRIVNAELLLDVHKHGFSRILVYSKERSNVIGTVKLRDFALITPEQYDLIVKHVLEFHSLDNHRKIQRKRTKTMNFTALAKRPIKGPSISLRLKIAVFQFLSTNVPQFSSAFMSQEILKVIPHYNVYAIIEQQTNQSANFIYLYKKRFRCELFTLVLQGTFFFAASTLVMTNKTLKDAQEFLERLLKMKAKLNNVKDLAC